MILKLVVCCRLFCMFVVSMERMMDRGRGGNPVVQATMSMTTKINMMIMTRFV